VGGIVIGDGTSPCVQESVDDIKLTLSLSTSIFVADEIQSSHLNLYSHCLFSHFQGLPSNILKFRVAAHTFHLILPLSSFVEKSAPRL
jgi:hypothetical protein